MKRRRGEERVSRLASSFKLEEKSVMLRGRLLCYNGEALRYQTYATVKVERSSLMFYYRRRDLDYPAYVAASHGAIVQMRKINRTCRNAIPCRVSSA